MWNHSNNTPQAILDFIQAVSEAVKNPASLKPLVEAAQAVNASNELSADLLKKQEVALADIEQSKAEQAKLGAAHSTLAEAKLKMAETEKNILAREQAVEQQRREAESRRQENEERAKALDRRAETITARENAAVTAEAANEQLAEELGLREANVSKREQNLAQAQELVRRPVA